MRPLFWTANSKHIEQVNYFIKKKDQIWECKVLLWDIVGDSRLAYEGMMEVPLIFCMQLMTLNQKDLS